MSEQERSRPASPRGYPVVTITPERWVAYEVIIVLNDGCDPEVAQITADRLNHTITTYTRTIVGRFAKSYTYPEGAHPGQEGEDR